jgi:diguanylate cyclase (GGDEF)-like protein
MLRANRSALSPRRPAGHEYFADRSLPRCTILSYFKAAAQSITDGLTSIKTRRFFGEALTGSGNAPPAWPALSVVLIDLDKFKEVNDTFGHMEGDLVLRGWGGCLNRMPPMNVVARYGGDEFVILMPETGVEQAQILAERLRLWLATDPMLSEHKITGSLVASFLCTDSQLKTSFGRRRWHVCVQESGRRPGFNC